MQVSLSQHGLQAVLCVRASAKIPYKWNVRSHQEIVVRPWEQLELWVSSCLIYTEKSQSSGKTVYTYKVKCGYEKPMRAQDGTLQVLFCLVALTRSAELHWICWVQHENKKWPLISASAVGWRESVEKKHRRGRQDIHSICVCWHLHGHSQERQIHFQSEVNPTESQDRRVGKFKSITLFGLWFWNHCTLQRVVLCGRWLRCYNYHYNYTGMFPSWNYMELHSPWNYSPVTWAGFLIVLARWVIAFFLACPQAGRVSMNWKARNAKTVSSRAKKKMLLMSTLTATITCDSFSRWGGGGTKEPEHPKNLALQRRRTLWD